MRKASQGGVIRARFAGFEKNAKTPEAGPRSAGLVEAVHTPGYRFRALEELEQRPEAEERQRHDVVQPGRAR